jgi:hypothetical protein
MSAQLRRTVGQKHSHGHARKGTACYADVQAGGAAGAVPSVEPVLQPLLLASGQTLPVPCLYARLSLRAPSAPMLTYIGKIGTQPLQSTLGQAALVGMGACAAAAMLVILEPRRVVGHL